jgi:hypothetical protein
MIALQVFQQLPVWANVPLHPFGLGFLGSLCLLPFVLLPRTETLFAPSVGASHLKRARRHRFLFGG